MSAPYMPFYVGDYIKKTQHLTTEQHGAYLLLIFSMFAAGGSLPNDDRKLARIARLSNTKWASNRDDILEFFTVEGDILTHTKVTEVSENYQKKIQKLAQNGAKGGIAKSLKDKRTALANAKDLPCQPEPEPELYKDTDVSFTPKPPKQSSKTKQEIITPDRAVFDDCRKRLSPKGKERLTLAKAWVNWQSLTKTHGADLVVAAFNHWNDSQDCQKEGGRFQGDLAIWLRDKAPNIIELLNEGSIHDFNANHHNHANQLPGQGHRATGSNAIDPDDGLFGYLMGELSKTV